LLCSLAKLGSKLNGEKVLEAAGYGRAEGHRERRAGSLYLLQQAGRSLVKSRKSVARLERGWEEFCRGQKGLGKLWLIQIYTHTHLTACRIRCMDHEVHTYRGLVQGLIAEDVYAKILRVVQTQQGRCLPEKKNGIPESLITTERPKELLADSKVIIWILFILIAQILRISIK